MFPLEDLAELGLSGLSTGLTPDECPVGIFEVVRDVHDGRAVPQPLVGRRAGRLNRERGLVVGVHAPENRAELVSATVANLAAARLQ